MPTDTYFLPSLSGVQRLTARGLLTFLCVVLGAWVARAQDAAEKPVGQLFVVETKGRATITVGNRLIEIVARESYPVEGSVIITDADSTVAVVLSNDVGLVIGAQSQIEFRRFSQQPLPGNRTDLDTEPSVTEAVYAISRGSLSLCGGRMLPGSTVTYVTPQATIAVRSRQIVLNVSDLSTRVAVLEGEATVRGDLRMGTATLVGLQQAVITRFDPGQPPTLVRGQIPDADLRGIEEQGTLACIARRTAFFEPTAPEQPGGTPGLRPIIVAPAPPSPPVTVSPATIPNPNP